MKEKRCILCNKPYNYKYVMFGRGCLDNLYDLLGFSKPPKIIWNKELFLCTKIAWKNHKFFLSKKKKYALAQKYIALNYLKLMNLEFLEDIKEKISKDINSITVFSKNIVETISFTLNEIYKLFNYSQKFNELLKEFKKINWEELDEKLVDNYIKNVSFIFDTTKQTNPISYTVFYSMQYMFWQVVVVGGILTNKKLSSKLLSNSLSIIGQKPKDLIIDDDEITALITKSTVFKEKLNQLIEKYGEGKEEFIIDNKKEDSLVRFESGDLLYALHNATMNVKAKKDKENKWNFDIEINDTYDFTDFKDLKEYADTEKGKIIDIFSTTLNNFGVVSSEYGVIKTFDLKIKFKTKEGEF